MVWDLISDCASLFTGGVPIGANGCGTMLLLVLNPVENSMFVKPRPSLATKSGRMLLTASPPVDALTLPELAEELVFFEVERVLRGTCMINKLIN